MSVERLRGGVRIASASWAFVSLAATLYVLSASFRVRGLRLESPRHGSVEGASEPGMHGSKPAPASASASAHASVLWASKGASIPSPMPAMCV
ncbi:hypothetical protein L226DRAFT_535610 [Lentinus tigrinus ALCF2SS1-7]|uniref:uncharacterized protein n=1 Tax=Lentinus tigrinus ALCF2SS1-7 TaxID=1328758 RepID=UPI0011661F45|nr:hypothetical protein L226DRAFT_535610 [Lentinus tigrinus ALCF2SS1-7]